jgi:hypothetical protein
MFEATKPGRADMTLSTVLSARRGGMLQRVLRVGFWFFLVKGLLWLALPVVLHQALTG